MAKAVERELINYRLIDFREFARDKHRTCDDAPYGGGAGMVLKPEPLGTALDMTKAEFGSSRVVYLTPSGRPLTQKMASELASEESLTLICGRYEGVDQRIIDLYVDDEVCVGDYVLSSGEVAALVLVDAVYRLREGVISQESLEEESFQKGLLEYPHYTRPDVYQGVGVPEVLKSGHHLEIEKWRLKKSVEKTLTFRPDLIRRNQTPEVDKLVNEIMQEGSHNGFGESS